MYTSHQLRAARALLDWSASELAEHAGVHIATVQRMERHDGKVRGNAATVEKILGALETLGIEFINHDGRQGVVLRAPEQESN